MSSRKPTPELERVNVTIRLPRWLVTWLDATAKIGTSNKTELIESGIIKGHKLKAPKQPATPANAKGSK